MDEIHTDVDRSAAALMGFYNHKKVTLSVPDALERGKKAGFNVQIRGDHVTLYPRISRGDFSALQDLSLHTADDVMNDLLHSMSGMSTQVKQKFAVDRRAVWKPLPDGGYRLILVPRVPQAVDEIDIIAGEPTEIALRKLDVVPCSREDLQSRPQRRTYQLMQVFNDVTILDKFDLSLRQIEAAKRTAASDATAASRILQDAMNACQDRIWVSIKATAWTKSRKQAANTIDWFCRDYRYASVPYAVEFSDDKVYMYAPQGEDWIVSGPVKYTVQIRALHSLVCAEGRIFPSVLLSMECVLLGIDIGTQYCVAEPTIIYHAGKESLVTSGFAVETARMLSMNSRSRIEQLSQNLAAVKTAGGIAIATAVQVTDDIALVNNHVFADTGESIYIDNDRVSPTVQMSRDIWALNRPHENFKPWVTRDAQVGEMAVLVGMGANGMYVTPPLKVISVDNTCVVTARDPRVVAGMSGAALVSLRDTALLGIHSAATGTNLLAYKFGPKDLSQLVMRDSSIPDSSYEDDQLGRRVIAHFRKRGLLTMFRQAANCVHALYDDNKHVGMAVVNERRLLTSCDVTEPLYIRTDQVPITWRSAGPGVFYSDKDIYEDERPVFVRKPKVMEKVFILGKNTEPYLAGQTQITYVGLDAKSFLIADFRALDVADGGLIVGWDGAVVGILGYHSKGTTVGKAIRCWPFPEPTTTQVMTPRELLATAFPILNTVVWTDTIVDNIFVDPLREQGQSLGYVGNSAIRHALGTILLDRAIPFPQWEEYESRCTGDETMLRIADTYGLKNMITCPTITTRSGGEKCAIAGIRALIGAVSMIETTDTFISFLRSVGVFDFDNDSHSINDT